MIRLDPDTLYSRADLLEVFAEFRLDADAVIARIKPRKVFRCMWLGSDILAALRSAPALGESAHTEPVKPTRRRARGTTDTSSLDNLIKRAAQRQTS